MRYLWMLIVLIPSVALAGTLYQWVDENGVKHFSNTIPGNNAETRIEEQAKPISPEEAARRQRESFREERQQEHKRKIDAINQKHDDYVRSLPKQQEKPKPSISISSPRWDSNTRTLSISGRVEAYGQSIKYLIIYAHVSDNEGFSTIIRCSVSDITAGSSRIIEGSERLFGKHGDRWKLSKYEYNAN